MGTGNSKLQNLSPEEIKELKVSPTLKQYGIDVIDNVRALHCIICTMADVFDADLIKTLKDEHRMRWDELSRERMEFNYQVANFASYLESLAEHAIRRAKSDALNVSDLFKDWGTEKTTVKMDQLLDEVKRLRQAHTDFKNEIERDDFYVSAKAKANQGARIAAGVGCILGAIGLVGAIVAHFHPAAAFTLSIGKLIAAFLGTGAMIALGVATLSKTEVERALAHLRKIDDNLHRLRGTMVAVRKDVTQLQMSSGGSASTRADVVRLLQQVKLDSCRLWTAAHAATANAHASLHS